MLQRLGVIIKRILSHRLTYDEIFMLVDSPTRNPRPLDFLTESVDMSWTAVTAGESGTFNEYWKSYRLKPFLEEIAAQHTHSLQRYSLRGILLDEAAKGKWAATVLNLSEEDAGKVLKEYPDSTASENSVSWKLNHVSLELCFVSLNTAVLLELGRTGFGIKQKEFEAWTTVYAEAYGQQLAQASLLGVDAEISLKEEMRTAHNDELLYATVSTIAVMREEIASDKADADQTASRYQKLVDRTNALLEASE